MEPAQAKVEPAQLVCPECGAWIRELVLGTACEKCLNRRYLRAMLEREREAWTSTTFVDVELSRGRTRLRHVVLKVDRGLSFCGAPATEPKKKRMRVEFSLLQEGICTDCLDNLHRVQLRAQEARKQGAPT